MLGLILLGGCGEKQVVTSQVEEEEWVSYEISMRNNPPSAARPAFICYYPAKWKPARGEPMLWDAPPLLIRQDPEGRVLMVVYWAAGADIVKDFDPLVVGKWAIRNGGMGGGYDFDIKQTVGEKTRLIMYGFARFGELYYIYVAYDTVLSDYPGVYVIEFQTDEATLEDPEIKKLLEQIGQKSHPLG